jgi:hypothetical protein
MFSCSVLAVFLLVSSASDAADSYLLPPDQPVAGFTQEEWSRAWWQWAGSFDDHASPVADQTGELCASKQSGKVWFLAGTYGIRRTIRTCTVPRGRYLFFPLINYIVMPTAGGSTSCTSVIGTAARMTDGVSNLVLDVDGVRYTGLAIHRQATRRCFDIGALAEPKVQVYPSAANGYYVMLHPLPPGKHTLNFGGVLPGLLQAVTYTLLVK